jgi:hypothetical protein
MQLEVDPTGTAVGIGTTSQGASTYGFLMTGIPIGG